MLSNLIVNIQKFVLFKDELGHERISQKFITQLLKEQGENVAIKILPVTAELSDVTTLEKFLTECGEKPQGGDKLWNVILPSLSDLLTYQKVSALFPFLYNLKKSEYVKRTFLWISLPHLQHDHVDYVVASFEYISDMVVHIISEKELSLLVCKPGGGVTLKHYSYSKTKSEFKVELKQSGGAEKSINSKDTADDGKTELQSTFKIELDEEEMVARNAMKMPYEKAVEATESNIIYTPDSADDFDDEDPDEDLNI